MTALAILLGVALVATLPLIAWLVHGRVTAADQLGDARHGQSITEGELERKGFELEVTKKALEASNARAAALEEVLADEVAADPNPDLARGDVRGRLLRIARSWSDADADRVPADGGGALPLHPATEVPDPAAVPED